MDDVSNIYLFQSYGDHGLRFAGPDLLDYVMIFNISCGEYDGDRLRIDSSYHPCCGTLEINASLMTKYKRWSNKLDGCKQHQRDGGGDRIIRQLVWNSMSLYNLRIQETVEAEKFTYIKQNIDPWETLEQIEVDSGTNISDLLEIGKSYCFVLKVRDHVLFTEDLIEEYIDGKTDGLNNINLEMYTIVEWVGNS